MNALLKSQDLFGKPVSLTLKGEGDTVKTVNGGLFSVLIKVFILWYGVSQFLLVVDRTHETFGQMINRADFTSPVKDEGF